MMIRALVLDVDGVLVGDKIGYNSPNPHPDVITRILRINASGIPVVICTGKPHYAVAAIIDGAKLSHPHITNSGSVVIDPITHTIINAYTMPKPTVLELLDAFTKHRIYTELYTVDDYYLETQQVSDLTKTHAHILQRDPVLVDSLRKIAEANDVVKLLPVMENESGIPKLEGILSPFTQAISYAWSLHPIANPHQFCGITARDISKRQTTLDVLKHLGVLPEHALGVGDSSSDWKYMELCGYVAAVENAQDPLKDLVRKRGNQGYIGGHVDNNGILSILDHFSL